MASSPGSSQQHRSPCSSNDNIKRKYQGDGEAASPKRRKSGDSELGRYFDNDDTQGQNDEKANRAIESVKFTNILTAMCENTVLVTELGKHLPVKDILTLYSTVRSFHHSVNAYLLSNIRTWVEYKALEAGRIFPFQFYRRHLVPDPAGRSWEQQYESGQPVQAIDDDQIKEVRNVPGLKYLQLVLGRDQRCREMKAILARNGHRFPASIHSTLLKLWLLMDIATTAQRGALLRNRNVWTDVDLYNAQMFFVKLGLHFNDPIYGPRSYDLLRLMMGQKGLFPLWQLLLRKRFTTVIEILELKVRYDFQTPPDHWAHEYYGETIYGVPFNEIGVMHLEGWGKGTTHLLRPDELVPIEATSRGLQLRHHLVHMMVWGYINRETGENLVPSLEELHLSDEETLLKNVDTSHHWKSKHALKKHWHKLSPEQQQEIMDDDEDERLRAMAWCGDDSDASSSSSGDDSNMAFPYDPNDEIERGFIVQTQDKNHQSDVPALDDQMAWRDFISEAMQGLALEVDDDQLLRAQPFLQYTTEGEAEEWDWEEMLRQAREVPEGYGSTDATYDNSGDEGDTMLDANDGDDGFPYHEINSTL